MAPDDDVWRPPPEVVATPGGGVRLLPSDGAAREAWLARRFPEAHLSGDRRRTEVRRSRRLVALSVVAVVAVGWLVGMDFLPDDPQRTPTWVGWLFLPLVGLAAAGGIGLVVATGRPPAVSRAEREVLERLTEAQARALMADMRAPEPSDPGDLDVVAAAWLAEPARTLLLNPWRVTAGIALLTRWPPAPEAGLIAVLTVLAARDAARRLRRLLAARAWVRRRTA